MHKGHVTHAETDGVHVLRYFGRVDYVLAPAIKRFADDLVSRGDVHGWIFDLTNAELLDSTNLGLLARLADRTGGVAASERSRSVIVSTSDDINSVLRTMSFDEIFEIVGHAPDEEPGGAREERGEAIAAESSSPREIGETMLDAHRALVALSEVGRLQFEDVVTALEADLDPGDA